MNDLFTEFMKRGDCGCWNDTFKVIYIMSNIWIAAAYFTIPVSLVFIRFEWEAIAKSTLTRLSFAAFIFSCGIGHILDGVGAFWYPYYHLFALWHAFTAVCSWMTIVIPLMQRMKPEATKKI